MLLKSGYPYYLIHDGLVHDYPKLEKDLRTDVVIMGGGISGALTAYALVKEGIPCTVVDARSIGLGSTCASTSLLQYELDVSLSDLTKLVGESNARRSYQLCSEAIDKLILVADKIGFQGIQKKKSLYYAVSRKDAVKLKEEFIQRKKAGFRVRFLEEDDINEQLGFKAPAGILSQQAAQTDSYMFTHFLHQYNTRKGAAVYDRTPITKIKHHKKSVELRTANGHTIKAKKLVYATGYEVVQYVDQPIVKLLSTYAIASETISGSRPFWKDDMLIWNTAEPYLYLRTTPDNRILIGGRDENYYSPARRDKLINRKRSLLTKDFSKLFPHITFIPEFSWTGTFGSTKDGLPYIGTYPKLPNSYFALGFGGNGITFSMVAAELVASLLKGKRSKDLDLFSFER
jgi:glycine/D-amino acid oxidase-like deaminating enzyme